MGGSQGWNLTEHQALSLWLEMRNLVYVLALEPSGRMPVAGHLPLLSLSFLTLHVEALADKSTLWHHRSKG